MEIKKYKRIIKRILINTSNEQLQITIPNGCGIEAGDLVKIVPFEKKIDKDILKHVLINTANNQLMLTIPRVSSLEKGDLIEIVPVVIKPIDMNKYPIYERSDVYKNEKGRLKVKKSE